MLNVVYFIRDGSDGPIKIGKTGNLRRRIMALQSANPTSLLLLGYSNLLNEEKVHEQFSHLRLAHEWFKAEPELLDFISRASVGTELPDEHKPANLHIRLPADEYAAFKEAAVVAGFDLTTWIRLSLRKSAGLDKR